MNLIWIKFQLNLKQLRFSYSWTCVFYNMIFFLQKQVLDQVKISQGQDQTNTCNINFYFSF